jgi:hypothetical protein
MKDLVLPSTTLREKWLDTRVANRVCTPKFLGEIEGGEGFLGYFRCQKCSDETNLYSLVKVLGYFMELNISSALDLYKAIYVPTYCNLDETKSLILNLQWSDNVTRKLARNFF